MLFELKMLETCDGTLRAMSADVFFARVPASHVAALIFAVLVCTSPAVEDVVVGASGYMRLYARLVMTAVKKRAVPPKKATSKAGARTKKLTSASRTPAAPSANRTAIATNETRSVALKRAKRRSGGTSVATYAANSSCIRPASERL